MARWLYRYFNPDHLVLTATNLTYVDLNNALIRSQTVAIPSRKIIRLRAKFHSKQVNLPTRNRAFIASSYLDNGACEKGTCASLQVIRATGSLETRESYSAVPFGITKSSLRRSTSLPCVDSSFRLPALHRLHRDACSFPLV